MNPTSTQPQRPASGGRRRPRAGSAPRSRARFATPASRSRGPLGRGEVPRGCDAILLCVPDARDRRGRGDGGRRRAAASATRAAPPRSPRSAPPAAPRFGLHPLQTVRRTRRVARFDGCRLLPWRARRPRRSPSPRELAQRARHDAVRDRRRAAAPPTTPPPRSPRTSWSRSRRRRSAIAAGAGLGRRRGARALLAPLVRRTVENWAALGPERGAHRARSPAATTRPSRRSAPRSRRPRRSCSTLFDELGATRTRALARRARAPHEDRPHRRRAARAARARAPRRPRDRAGADDGLLPRRPPVADAPRARGERRRGGLAVREPRPVRPGRGLRRLPARRGSATPSWPRPRASTSSSRRRSTRSTPTASTPTVDVGGLTEMLEGDPAQRGAEHFAGRDHGRHQALQHGRPGRRLLRPEGRPAGARDPQARARPEHPGADRGLPHGARRGRPGAELAQRLPRARRSASARSALSRALRAAEAAGRRRRRATPPRCWPPRARSSTRAGIEPEYLELRSAHDLSPVERVNGSTLLAVAARVGRARLIDNTILGGDRNELTAPTQRPADHASAPSPRRRRSASRS